MIFLLERDENGDFRNGQSCDLGQTIDVWYQSKYPFGNSKIKRENIKVNEQGELSIILPDAVNLIDETPDRKKQVDIDLKFAPYSRPRQILSRSYDPTTLHICGHLVNPPEVNRLFDFEELQAFQDAFRELIS